MDRRKLLGFLGFTTAASVIGVKAAEGATNERAKSYTPPKSEPVVQLPIGMILAMAQLPAYQVMPNWMICDGRRLSAREYPDLHAVIGKLFGSDSTDSDIFMLPDMRPRIMDYGSHSHAFIADDLPDRHGHTVVGPTHQHTMHDAWVTGRSLGNGEYEAVPAHNHVQPTLAIQHIIRVR